MVGTLRKNVKELPKDILSAKIKKGEIKGKENSNGVVVSIWKDKRDLMVANVLNYIKLLEKIYIYLIIRFFF